MDLESIRRGIGTKGTGILDLLEDIKEVGGNRDSNREVSDGDSKNDEDSSPVRMNLSTEKLDPLAIYFEGVLVPCHLVQRLVDTAGQLMVTHNVL